METCPRVHTQVRQDDAGSRCLEAWLCGEVDLDWRHDLDQLVQAFQASDATEILLHCQAVTFLASTGIAAFWQLRQLADSRGGGLTLSGTITTVRRTLQLAGLDGAIVLA